MVDDALRRRSEDADTSLIGIVQLRHFLLGSTLLLRLDLALLTSVIALKKSSLMVAGAFRNKDRMDFIVNLEANRQDCVQMSILAQEGNQPRQLAEGHLLFARYAALEASVVHCSQGREQPVDTEGRVPSIKDLREEGLAQLELCQEICDGHKGTTKGLQNEIDATRKMLESEFYQAISSDERRQVLEAMASEFSAVGHWYTCPNGHPFTVGECGAPMEQTPCPECGELIGGQHHTSVAGVRRADELEREAAELTRGVGGLNLG